MKRKVIKQGNGTLTMTLPKQWARNFSVKAGDELNIDEKGRDLIVHSRKGKQKARTNVKLSTADRFMVRYLENPYRLGYNELYISFEDPKIIKKVRETLPRLMGFEMVEQGSRYCVLRQLMTEEEGEFRTTFNRLFHIVGEMGKDCAEAAGKRDKEKAEEIVSTELLTNKFANFCERILNTRAYEDPKHTNLIYYIVCGLEQIADKYKEICLFMLDNKSPVSREILKIMEDVNEAVEEYRKLYHKFNKEGQFRLRQHKKKALNRIENAPRRRISDIIILEKLSGILDILEHMSMRTHEEYQPVDN